MKIKILKPIISAFKFAVSFSLPILHLISWLVSKNQEKSNWRSPPTTSLPCSVCSAPRCDASSVPCGRRTRSSSTASSSRWICGSQSVKTAYVDNRWIFQSMSTYAGSLSECQQCLKFPGIVNIRWNLSRKITQIDWYELRGTNHWSQVYLYMFY